jgi:hypothetical protein
MRGLSRALGLAACAAALSLLAAGEDPAAAMRARYAAMKDDPGRRQFHRPLHLDSNEGPDAVSGEITAVVGHPFAIVGSALGKPSHWCDVMLLHFNTKSCRASTEDGKAILQVRIGKKHDQPMDQAYRVDFAYRVAVRGASYLQVSLDADEGPLGTHDYRIVLEAAPAEGSGTLIRLSYSYAFGRVGKLAMQAYLGTIGRDKVGFTLAGVRPGGEIIYVGGMRGAVERNTMRYFLAIEAFLGALSTPAEARVEKSLRDWFAACERYARQLHEMEQGEYLGMKRKEYSRQQPG